MNREQERKKKDIEREVKIVTEKKKERRKKCIL